MSHTSASLVNLWEFEGQNSPNNSRSNKNSGSTASTVSPLKAELIEYYQKHGLETIAKEVGIIHSNGEIVGSKSTNQPRELRAQIITLPVVSTATTIAMSPFKMEPAILPKTVHLSSSPVILSTPQRVVASVINNSRTPQHLLPATEHAVAWSGKRPHEFADEYSESKRCKKGEKGGKGLRHFSMKVCEKVRKKGTTSYNEVADELVAEFSDPHRHMCPTDQAYDQKNIRRRVYDALNVLMAMNIISKEKKEIKWLGLPTNSAQEYQNLEKEKQKKIEKIRLKTLHLQELIIQQIAFKNLAARNRDTERQMKCPPPTNKIRLPFILLTTHKDTVIDCSISGDKKEYRFCFNDVFQISDDTEVLKRMGLDCGLDKGSSTPEDINKAKNLVPKALQPYINLMSQGKTDLPPGMISEGNGVKIEGDYFSDPSRFVYCELQEASSSSSGPGSEYVDIENALDSTKSVLSRQSSVGSLSDLPSRPGTSTPSEDYSDCDSESLDGEESN
ncbi:transcription factor Dp-1-like isoform X2 [Stegodyphus dumicola]|uniref:transcription factor Dp-1-like isoform X2 n=1 Tax=Stegodyphus dumicola TaxID=202533 RepID=UPI0015AE521D|nr:transcription factor Dp-1-like isoform X2 [Stegodyphus dumicola]